VEIDVHDATPEEAASYARMSPGGLIRKALAQASAYTVGGFGVRAAEFILLPLYWALLPPSQYGVLAVAAIVVEFLKAVFGFGLPEAIARFWHEWSPEERTRRIGAIWTGSWFCSGLLAAALLMVGPALTEPFIRQVAFSPYLELAILAALASSMVQVPLMLLRMMERPGLYVSGTAATTLLGAALAVWLVAVEGRGALGVLEAQVASSAVVALSYAWILRGWARPAVDRATLGTLLAFSLPLIPSKLLDAAATVVDRFILEKHLSLEALGVYHAARQVGRGVELLGFGLLTAWIPFQMRVLAERSGDGRRMIARAAPWFLLVILIASVAVALVVPPSISLLDISGYGEVPRLVPLAVLAGAISSLAHVLIQGYIIARKTQYAWLRSGTRLLVVVGAVVLLVPIFGIEGALVALALAALAQAAVGYALAQRFFPISFRWGTILGMVAGGILSVSSVALLPPLTPLSGLAAGLAITAAYGVGATWLARASAGPS